MRNSVHFFKIRKGFLFSADTRCHPQAEKLKAKEHADGTLHSGDGDLFSAQAGDYSTAFCHNNGHVRISLFRNTNHDYFE